MLVIIIMLPTILGIVNYLVHNETSKGFTLVIQALIVLLTGYTFFVEDLQHASPMIQSLGGYDSLYSVNLMADPISALLIFATSLIFLSLLIYDYGQPHMQPHFLLLFHMLESLIFALFLVQDLFSLYAITEVSTLVVSVLIMYKKDLKDMYDGMVYLLVNIIAMTFFLMGIGFIYKIFGTMNLMVLKSLAPHVPPTQLILPYTLLLTGISTKVLFLPVFGWLTKAHVTDSTPYIISAMLSGLYIKTGIYLFTRLQQIFGDLLNTGTLFLVIAFLTAVAGALLAVMQDDIKHLLAYSTVSQVGLILVGMSINSQDAYYGAIYHIISHSLFKTLLFLCAGTIIDHYKTRNLRAIKGVLRTMPITGFSMILALMAMTGAPLFNGSISKYLIQRDFLQDIGEYLILFINLLTLAYSLKLAGILIGPKKGTTYNSTGRNVVMPVFGLLCFLGGFFSHYLVRTFFQLEVLWTPADYLDKSITYGLSIAFILQLNRWLPKNKGLIVTAQHIELTFNELVYGIFILFTGLLGYLSLVSL